ncbi:MAG: hypothetical protein KDI83_20880, partial [Gammaproteobacteria bacterium]|nr:hypothetical protein [Gammaproteobacteria bacterium]
MTTTTINAALKEILGYSPMSGFQAIRLQPGTRHFVTHALALPVTGFQFPVSSFQLPVSSCQ